MITYGLFVDAVINFMIVAFVIFLLVKGVNRLKRQVEKEKKEEASVAAEPEAPPADVALLTEIRDLLAKARD